MTISVDYGALNDKRSYVWFPSNGGSAVVYLGTFYPVQTIYTLCVRVTGLTKDMIGGSLGAVLGDERDAGYIHSSEITESDVNAGQKILQGGIHLWRCEEENINVGSTATFYVDIGTSVTDKNGKSVYSNSRSFFISATCGQPSPSHPSPEPKPPAREKPKYDVKFGTLYINNKTMQHNNFSNECTRNKGTMTFKDTIKGKEWEWAKVVTDKKIVYVSTVFARRDISIDEIIQANDTVVTIDKNKYKLKTLIEYNQLCYIINDMIAEEKIDLEYDADTSKYDIPLKDIETSDTSSINEYTVCSVNDHYPYIHYSHAIKGKDKKYDTVVLPILEPIKDEEEPPKGIDLGVQNAAFGVRYLAKDPDKEQTLTVVEKLNGNIIQTINNFDRSQPGMVKITNELLRPLLIGSVNYIEINASDGFVTVKQILTFTKGNTPPTITCYCSDEIRRIRRKTCYRIFR